MSEYLPKEVRDGLVLSGSLSRAKPERTRPVKASMPRLRVEVAGESFMILKYSEHGFSVRADDTPRLPGFVDVYDGSEHLCRGLVVATTEEAGELNYEFKRHQCIAEHAPLDYVPDPDWPGGSPV